MIELKQFLKDMIHKKASDVVFTVGSPPQLRISGNFYPVENFPPLKNIDVEKILFPLLTEVQIERFKKERELDISAGLEGISRFRLNAYYQRDSIGIAIRIIPYQVPQIDTLGLPSIVKEFSDKPNGLILVTGPTGCGKSTTLAAMIDYINERRPCHIITVEDPIEFVHIHKKAIIDQREVGSDTLSFQEALRHVLRETPDVIMIGEMRDLDTIQAALTLAETGHLILATLHTQSASHAIGRIIDVFPSEQQQQTRVQLSEVLVGVIVQQLLPRKDGQGLVLAAEVMSANTAIKNLIRENSIHQIYSAIQTGSAYGMATFNASLAKLVKNGLIEREMALQYSSQPKELEALIVHA